MEAQQGTMFQQQAPTCRPILELTPKRKKIRLSPQKQKLLRRLRRGPANNYELNRMVNRFGGRLHEMKDWGIVWKKKHVVGSEYLYTLISTPPEVLALLEESDV